jgi:hypothetical protein
MSGHLPMGTPIEKQPFSNGTEGYAWIENWCDRCLHDKPAREDRYEDACQILAISLLGQTPAEWIRQPGFVLGDTYHCIDFRDEDDGPPPPTEPEPTPPGQGEMFPMEGFVGTRMFADVVAANQPTPTPVSSGHTQDTPAAVVVSGEERSRADG